MTKVRILVYALLLLLLAACSQDEGSMIREGGLYALPSHLSQQESSLTSWDVLADYSVEVKALGLGAEASTVPACDCVEATLTVDDPDSVVMIYAQVVNKGKGADPKTDLPDEVKVSTATETKTWTGGGLTQSYVHPQGGAPLTDGGQVYEGAFGPADELTARVEGVHTGGFYQPRAFIIYIFREADTVISVGTTPNYYVFHDTATETLSIPASDVERDVDVTFAVSELGADPRDIVLSASAGGVSVTSGSISTPDDDEVLVYTLTLNVPAGVTEVTATVTSPDSGDSVYWDGLNITAPLPPEDPESAPGRFTGGGWVTVDDVKYTFGLTLHCDVELSNNLEINWSVGKGKDAVTNQWHLEKESLVDVLCSDDPDIMQPPPAAPLDTLTAEATGRLTYGDTYKQAGGSIIRFTIVDDGEPGRKDRISVMIWAPGDDPDSSDPLVSFGGELGGGNLQAHYDQPHGNKP